MTRCAKDGCKRKLPLTAFACRCNLLYCDVHRPPEEHACKFDYFNDNKAKMEKNLSSIVFTKKELLFQEV